MVLAMETLMDVVGFKKIIVIAIGCVILSSCKAQKDSLLYDMTPIDIEQFYKQRDHLNDYKYYTKDSTYVYIHGSFKPGDTTKTILEYTKKITPKGSLYTYIYTYRKNRTLHKTFKSYPNRFTVYRIVYDTLGRIKEKDDRDKLYPYTFSDVQLFLSERGIALKDVYITRGISSEIPMWNITWKIKYYKGIRVILDGRTGEVLEETKFNYYQ